MISSTGRAILSPGRRTPGRRTAAAICALALAGGLAGCKVVSDVKNAAHDVASNRATIKTFTQTMKSGPPTPFVVRYATTGSSPATIVYAVRPPREVAFTDTPSGTATGPGIRNLHLVVNGSGAYSCSPPSSAGTRWTCQQLAKASAATRNKVLEFYTPSHWVTFLKGFAVAAGFAGDKVRTSAMTVNGFSLKCVDLQAAGIAGTSRICTTAQGLLGYVKVASVATSFEITSYSTSPPASLFALPAHAKITRLKTETQ
jgi:hypothetical protein